LEKFSLIRFHQHVAGRLNKAVVDKAYDSEALIEMVHDYDAQTVIGNR